MLVHESVHHFGITEETFADQVAIAVYEAKEVTNCDTYPVDPFDPNSCTGKPMTKEIGLTSALEPNQPTDPFRPLANSSNGLSVAS